MGCAMLMPMPWSVTRSRHSGTADFSSQVTIRIASWPARSAAARGSAPATMSWMSSPQPSVLEPYLQPSPIGHAGRRVVAGQRLTQGPTDSFLGWCTAPHSGRQYYVRQLWDRKGHSDLTTMSRRGLTEHATLCAWALARAHARSGDAAAISRATDTDVAARGSRRDRPQPCLIVVCSDAAVRAGTARHQATARDRRRRVQDGTNQHREHRSGTRAADS